jgi:exodeoxyribonuclease VII small subunit
MKKEISFTEAFSELQEIVKEIEDGEISVDDLSVKVKRATFLIRACREKLQATGEDVQNILRELGEGTEQGT